MLDRRGIDIYIQLRASRSLQKDQGTPMASTAAGGSLGLSSLNHISIVCRSLRKSLDFYQNVLGFIPIRRPQSFDFDGAWLFNYGVGIHLLQSEDPASMGEKREINPKDDHISFQCESMEAVEEGLRELGISFVQRTVEEGGISVEQLFFHDPDGFMIEVCNCEALPVVPLPGKEPAWVCKRAPVHLPPPPPQCLPSVACHLGDAFPVYVDGGDSYASRY